MASTKKVVPSTTIVANKNANKESITLIWFDPTIGSSADTQVSMARLRQINDYVVFHTELESCVNYIASIENEYVFIITAGSRASELLPRLSEFRQIDAVFIFCMYKSKYEHLKIEYPKIVGFYIDLDCLCASIEQQCHNLEKQLEMFSLFDQKQNSTRDLSERSAEFVWFQLFHDVIRRLPWNSKAKEQMIHVCRQYYRDNPEELQLIDRFQLEYRPENAICWYSEESFVYKMINKALRSEDIDQLYTFRLFVADLSNSLAREHEKILKSGEQTLMFYRGTRLTRAELDKLKQNEGNLISTNGFWSTSRLRSFAVAFALKCAKRTDTQAVLFEIECDVQQLGKSIIFADIQEFSKYKDEQEVLFDLGAAFRIDNVEEDDDMWLIQMHASKKGRAIAQAYINEKRHETEGNSVAIVFGRLMCEMGQYEKSQKYFEQLFNDSNGEDLAWIEHNIARALFHKGELDAARKYYDQAYNRMINAEPPRMKDSAYVLNSLGYVLRGQAKFDAALKVYHRSLKIREHYYPAGHAAIAISLNSIGLVLHDQGKNDEALRFHREALTIRKKYYSTDHYCIADSLDDIGRILSEEGNYGQALDCHQQALKIREKYFSSDHVSVADSLNNIGVILSDQGRKDQAIEFHQRALVIREKFYPAGHINVADSLEMIGLVYGDEHNYHHAVEYLKRSLQMREQCLPADHPSIAQTLDNLAIVLDDQSQYTLSLEYKLKSLSIREKVLPADHIDIGTSLNNIGVSYAKMNKLQMALDYFKQALVIYKISLSPEHPDRVRTERNITRLRNMIQI